MTTTERADRAREADAAARRRAQREFDAPLVLEAGAGTGKTATLVARVIAWSTGPGWERAARERPDASMLETAERVLRGIVAITFTEAAAAEMAERVDEGLATLAKGEPLVGYDEPAPPERVAALRAALDHLVVQTIHAYCRRLLAAHPLEAGVHPLFEVDADGTALADTAREVAREQLSRGYGSGDEALLALAEAGIGPGELERALVAQLAGGARARELAEAPLAPERIAALVARLRGAHEALAEAANGRLLEVKRGTKAAAVDTALARAFAALARPARNAAELGALCAELDAAWSGTSGSGLAKWARDGAGGKDGFSKAEREALAERAPAVRDAARALVPLLAHARALEPERLAQLVQVLGGLALEVEERLRRAGRIGFDGLLTRAADLLSDAGVAARVRAGIDQLLIDEFQDTDPRQCAIAAALALRGGAESRPGLFLVGDPKQSIYGWRSADLAAYEGLLAEVRDAGGSVEPLCVNHRSVPAILDAVERVVAPVMQREAGVQPAFQPLAVSEALAGEPGFARAGRAPVEVWLPADCDESGAPRATRGADAAAIEARALARDLRALHDEAEVPWQEIGVLFRSRGEWDVYLSALREAGVPFRVEGDRSYYRRREILDAAALVCCALDPNDLLSLVTVLRSTAAGVPDAAWLPLWERGLPELASALGRDDAAPARLRRHFAEVAAALDPALPGLAKIEGWEHAAGLCVETIARLRRLAVQAPGDRFVEALRALTAFEGVEASRFLGRWRSANLERFFGDFAAALAEPGSPDAVLRALRRAVAEEELPSVEPAVHDASDAVSIVTLHGAKGLAWSHVYLAQLHKGESRQTPVDAVAFVEGRHEGRICGVPTLGFDAVSERRARVADAERVRMLYVGATRARRRLVLSGVWPALLPRGSQESHTALLAAGVGEGVDLAALAAAADDAGAVDAHGLRWRFVARERAEAPEADSKGAPQAEPQADPKADRKAEPGDARTLREAPATPVEIGAAARRMARARGRSVTGLVARVAAQAEPAERARAAAPPESAPGAAVVGSEVHAALERVEFASEASWARERERLAAAVGSAAPADARDEVVADALALWDVLASGPLAEALRERAPRLVARELPLLLPLADDSELAALAEYATGQIDLLYRDPDGGLVVADYKTDRRPPAAGPTAPDSAYARQGALYCRAVASALAAESAPRFELWWLREGVIERLPASAP